MKLLNYLKAHLILSLNKKNIISIIIFDLLIIGLSIYFSNIFIDSDILDSNRLNYLYLFKNNYYLIINVLYIFFVLINTLIFYSKEFDNYSLYFISDFKSKVLYILSKFIYSIIYYLSELLFLIIIYYFIMLITPYGDFNSIDYIYFINLFNSGLYYFLLSSIIIMIFENSFIIIIPLSIYWIGNVSEMFENNNVIELINLVSFKYDYYINDLIILNKENLLLFLILFISYFIKSFKKK